MADNEEDSDSSLEVIEEITIQHVPIPPVEIEEVLVVEESHNTKQDNKECESSECDDEEEEEENTQEEEDEDGQRCPICFEEWKGTGEHRLVSLKCGHLFGMSCITRWMKTGGAQGKKCPQCNTRCKKTDIRQIYAPVLKVKDTSEEDRLRLQLEKTLKEKKELEMKLAVVQVQVQKNIAVPSCSSSSSSSSSSKRFKPMEEGHIRVRHLKDISLGEKGGGRAMSYCNWYTQLSVTNASKFAGFGVMQIHCERQFVTSQIDSLHSKMIRDLKHFPMQTNSLLLTASMDCSSKLIDYRCNLVAQTYRTTHPIWSCCWDLCGASQTECHLISLGMTNGTVARFDMRRPSLQPITMLGKRACDMSPVSSLIALPPNCCPQLREGGLIVCQLKSCRLYVGDADTEGIVLPFQQPFLSIRSDMKSEHIIVTTRANNNNPTTHNIYRLTNNPNANIENICESILSIKGSIRQTLLSKPCIGQYNNDMIFAANDEPSFSVPLWSVSKGTKLLSVPVVNNVLDINSFSFNDQNYLAFLTEKDLSIYNYS